MNGKLAVGIQPEESVTSELLNPFVHHLELETTTEKVKTAVLTLILLPIRVIMICFLLTTGWLLACLALWGITDEELRSKPITGWRSDRETVRSRRGSGRRTGAALVLRRRPDDGLHERTVDRRQRRNGVDTVLWKKVTEFICLLGRSTFRVGGMHIVIKGRQASRNEAPILVTAPHSTFLDGGIIYFTGFPSIIVRRESGTNPYIGKLINFTQPVYVWRDDPNSRQNTIKEIINRATSDLDWPQILIFPEGTCTNRSCLITFKPGAFYPGVPIQPVCIRYPSKPDTVTWTWEGPSALKLLWLTLTQVYSSCEIEFLPVYNPSEEEKKDPKLFANNVRAVMAKALGVPVLDYTYDDCKLMTRAKEMNLPNASAIVEVQKVRRRLGLHRRNVEESIVFAGLPSNRCKLTYYEFASAFQVPASDPNLQQLFKLYDKDATGYVDFREYLLGVLAISNNSNMLDVLKIACKIYDSSGVGKLNANDFIMVLSQTTAMQPNEALEVFHQVDVNNLGHVTFEQFQTYASKKAEFAYLFSISKEEKFTPRNGVCPTDGSQKKID